MLLRWKWSSVSCGVYSVYMPEERILSRWFNITIPLALFLTNANILLIVQTFHCPLLAFWKSLIQAIFKEVHLYVQGTTHCFVPVLCCKQVVGEQNKWNSFSRITSITVCLANLFKSFKAKYILDIRTAPWIRRVVGSFMSVILP